MDERTPDSESRLAQPFQTATAGVDDAVAPASDDEAARLAALRRYHILDTPPEPAFDDITKLIAEICHTPVAIINFLDADRQCFKSQVGLDGLTAPPPLKVSICLEAIRHRGLFVVPDTLEDARFSCHPLVVGEPYLRFYAGAKLETPEGYPIGTLCVLDQMPRNLREDQKTALETLARQVMTQLELRRALIEQTHAHAALRDSEQRLRDIAENFPGVIFRRVTYPDGRVEYPYISNAVERVFRIPLDWAGTIRTPDDILRYVEPEEVRRWWAALQEASANLTPLEIEGRVMGIDGQARWVRSISRPRRREDGATVWDGVILDITEQHQAKESLQARTAELEVIMETVPAIIWLAHDTEARRITGSRYGAERLRLPPGINQSKSAAEGERPRNFRVLKDGVEMPPEQMPVQRAARGEEVRGEELQVVFDDGTFFWELVNASPVRGVDGRITGAVGAGIDITERKQAEDRLRASEERLREAQEIAGLGRWERNLVTQEITWSEEVFRIFGRDPKAGPPTVEELRDLRHPDDRDAFSASMAQLQTKPQVMETERRCRRPDGSYRWVRSRMRSFADASGRMVRMVGTIIDITDRKETEERQKLLMAELDHRVKNTLATVQSVVWQSLGRTPGAEALTGRLAALAKAHSLLSQSKWRGARLRVLLAEELRPYRQDDGERLRLQGPDIILPPKLVQALSLVLHELATNAAKYGALSLPEACLDVTWRLQAGDQTRLQLAWRESGGPPVAPPQHKGFGLRLIEQSFAYELDGTAQFEFQPDGLRCRMELPIDAATIQTAVETEAEIGSGQQPATAADVLGLRGKRILVVEDMVLVAMEIDAAILRAGCMVVGPVGRLDQALLIARQEQLDGAVLDVNLNGEMVFPVAAVLRQRGIPFVFVTGYENAAVLPQEFRDEPWVGKPLQETALVATLSEAIRGIS